MNSDNSAELYILGFSMFSLKFKLLFVDIGNKFNNKLWFSYFSSNYHAKYHFKPTKHMKIEKQFLWLNC